MSPPESSQESPQIADDITRLAEASPAAPRGFPDVPPAIPDFELLRRIGQGSYGEVWLARNVLGDYRAIKIVYRQTFESDRPFEREFDGIKRFEPISRSHESQVDILHVGRGAGYFYYVMELADDAAEPRVESSELRVESSAPTGVPTQLSTLNPLNYSPRTLRSELQRRGRLPFEECLNVALKLTTALAHLHQHGLVHRDVKPSNIIFVNGIPKLADIGLVARADATLSFVGTEGFLPPEGPGKPQADIYSLGKVFYEMCTGRDRQAFPELPTDVDGVSEPESMAELNEVIVKACDADVRRRYKSAEEMHADLVVIQAGKSLLRARVVERRLALLTKMGVAGIALTALLAAGYFYQQRQTRVAKRLTMQLQVQSGIRLLEDGDAPGALLWFSEALAGAESFLTAEEKEAHRFRLGAVLGECPRLLHALPHPREDVGPKVTISRDGPAS